MAVPPTAYATTTSAALVPPDSATAKTAELPSATVAEPAVTVTKSESSSTIVPVAWAVPSVTPAGRSGPASVTVKVSAASSISSSSVATCTVRLVSIGEKVSVPPAAV